MEQNTRCEERQELVKIYNNLTPSLKKQLLTLARVIDTTREITLNGNTIKKFQKEYDV